VELNWIGACVVAYLLPLALLRKYPQVLLWWLWVVGVIGLLVIYDSINHARLLATIKYVSLASVALYALCATPLPIQRWRWVLAYMILAGALTATILRIPGRAVRNQRGLAWVGVGVGPASRNG